MHSGARQSEVIKLSGVDNRCCQYVSMKLTENSDQHEGKLLNYWILSEQLIIIGNNEILQFGFNSSRSYCSLEI